MRRTCRKASVVAIVIAAVVAFVIFLLSTGISYLIAIRDEADKNLASYAIAYRKNLSFIGYLPNTDESSAVISSSSSRFMLKNDDFERKYRDDMISSIILSPTFRLILIVIIFILVYVGLFIFIVHLKSRKRRDGEQGIPIPVTIFISAATQAPLNS